MRASADTAGLRTGLATVTAGTAFLLVATVLLVAFNFVSRVVIVRSVSLGTWDAFSLGFTLTQVLLAVGGLGLPLAVARSLPFAATDDERRGILRSALTVGVASAAVAGVALFLAAPYVGRALGSAELGTGLAYFSVAVSALILSTLIAAVFQGFSNVTPNALFLQIVNPGIWLAALALAWVLPPHRITYTVALAGYAAAATLTLAATLLYAVRVLPPSLRRGTRDPTAGTRLLHLALPLFVTAVMASVAGFGDTLVLGAFHFAEVGTYTASLAFARLVQVGISAASYIFLPVASGFLARGDRRAVRLTYVTVTKWLTVVSLPLFVVFVFLPGSSLDLVYGSSYASVVLPLQIVVTGAFVGALLGPAAMAQVAAGQARLVAANSVAAGAADVLVSFSLVPRYGSVGAAEAWSVANVLYASLCLGELAVAERYHPFRRDFLLPLGATAIPGCALLVLWHPHLPLWALPVVVVAFALGFSLVVPLTGSIDDGDRLLLEAVERILGRPVPFVRRWAAIARRTVG